MNTLYHFSWDGEVAAFRENSLVDPIIQKVPTYGSVFRYTVRCDLPTFILAYRISDTEISFFTRYIGDTIVRSGFKIRMKDGSFIPKELNDKIIELIGFIKGAMIVMFKKQYVPISVNGIGDEFDEILNRSDIERSPCNVSDCFENVDAQAKAN